MRLKRKTLREAAASLLAFFLLLSSGPVAVFAQVETGQITVKATDPQGAVIAGATVSVKSTTTGAERTAITNEEGIAVITALQPGLYDVTVTAGDFAPNKQQANVTVGAKLSLEAQLSAAAKSESVTVVAGESGVEVNTQTQELSDVVSQKQISELPTLTRNPYNLISLSGNVSGGDPVNMAMRGTGFAINGQRSASTNILLDGGENVDAFSSTPGQTIPLDGVQEFRVITSNFSAEYGRASGGIVNVATKAGSNDFHGTLFEFNRVSALASNDFDDNANGREKGVFNRNQFGFSLGGRIIKDKLFFFNSTEWTRVRSIANVTNVVPTPELIAASNPRTQAIFAKFPLGQPINGRVFTRAEVSAALGITGAGAFNSLPANLPALGNVIYAVPADVGAGSPQNSYDTVSRIDYNISDKTQVYGRYALESQDFFEGSNAFSPFAGFNTGSENFNNNFLASLTHTWSSTLVTQHKIVFNRLNNNQPLNPANPPTPTFFFRTNVALRLAGNRIALPGYLPFSPGSAIPFGGPQNFLQTYHDVNWTRGSHQFRFGGQYVHIRDNRTFGAFQNAVAGFGSTSTTVGFNNFVHGNLRRFQVAVDPQGNTLPGSVINLPAEQPNFSRSNRYHEGAAYANDTWRIRPNVTLNLGLRYEYYGVQHNARQELDSNFYLGQGSTIQERIRNGRVFRAKDSPVGALWKPDRNNFAPRVGVAWDVFGDGKMSLRGGYGIAYERNFGNVTFNVIQNPPAYAVVTIDSGTPGFPTIPVSLNNLGPVGGTGTAALPGQINIRHVDENIVNAYAHFWSAALEREIGAHTVASIEYSGSAGRKLYDLTNDNRIGSAAHYFNEPLGTPGNPLSLLNPNYRPLNTRGNKGRSNYNAMILSVNSSDLRNLGLQLTTRYTYSVTKDNLSSTFSESNNNFNLGLLDPFDPDLDYGNADFDVRHRFSASFNYEIGGHHLFGSGLMNRVFGGWMLAGIFTVRSGSPFTVFDCTNTAFEVCPRLVPSGSLSFSAPHNPTPAKDPNNFVLIDLRNQTPGNYIDPLTGTGEFGPFPASMTKRNAFRGPGFWNIDSGLYKNFKITEGKTLQFRGEFYNLFNHSNLFVTGESADVINEAVTDADGNLVAGGFVPGKRFGRRFVQLALKFIF
ncbi:MAG TPA: TonB-dependent receptor [Blastocatellia bacterium]|nr:TonB-dependent receptor [Blastocatellia bacterium]